LIPNTFLRKYNFLFYNKLYVNFIYLKSASHKLFFLFLAVSFNPPKFCSTPAWNRNGTTFSNQPIIGSGPRTIFINAKDSIYIVNQETNQILVWDDNNINPTKVISGNFSNSSSIFVTSNGDIYIDDGHVNKQVEKWISSTNTFVMVMNVYSSCYGLFVDKNDNLHCSMYNHHQVGKRALHDRRITSAIVAGTGTKGSASNELNHPHGIFVDEKFGLYVADCENDRVQLFRSGESDGITVAGRESSNPTTALDCPTGITFDAQKYLFIVDSNNHRILRSGVNGVQCLVGCHGSGSLSTQLSFPSSLSFDHSGSMFVVDQKNNRIQKFQYSLNSCGK
jgi:sugar lactone lactonase YvrE